MLLWFSNQCIDRVMCSFFSPKILRLKLTVVSSTAKKKSFSLFFKDYTSLLWNYRYSNDFKVFGSSISRFIGDLKVGFGNETSYLIFYRFTGVVTTFFISCTFSSLALQLNFYANGMFYRHISNRTAVYGNSILIQVLHVLFFLSSSSRSLGT